MTYTLRASNSTGQRCVLTQDVTVEFNPAPELLQMQSNYELCTNDVQELKVVNFVDEEPIKYLFNGNTNGVTLSNTVGADVISVIHHYIQKERASLKMAYGAQSNAILNFNAAINVTNLQSVIVEFDHIAALQATSSSVMDYAYLEYSTNNGATWAFLPSDYTGGANTGLTKPTVIPAYRLCSLPLHLIRIGTVLLRHQFLQLHLGNLRSLLCQQVYLQEQTELLN